MRQFVAEALFVDALEQARTKMLVYLDGSSNDRSGDLLSAVAPSVLLTFRVLSCCEDFAGQKSGGEKG